MGRSSGTGLPLTLRCYECKRGSFYDALGRDRRRGMNLEATGRTRPFRRRKGHISGIRQAPVGIEYRCLDCKHVGWSQHSDAARLLQRHQDGAEAPYKDAGGDG